MDTLQENTIFFAEDTADFISKTKTLLAMSPDERINKELIDEYLDNVRYDTLVEKIIHLVNE